MKDSSQLLKFTQLCMRLATEQIPPYSSKFSKHTFTQLQLLTLYCLKMKLGEMPRIQKALGLKQLPHFTTVQKAFQRLSPWRLLQRISAALGEGNGIAALGRHGVGSLLRQLFLTSGDRLRCLGEAPTHQASRVQTSGPGGQCPPG